MCYLAAPSMASVDDEPQVSRCAYGCQDASTCVTGNTAVRDDGNSTRSAVRSYRPHGSLARVLYDKRKADEWLAAYDKRRVSVNRSCFARLPRLKGESSAGRGRYAAQDRP